MRLIRGAAAHVPPSLRKGSKTKSSSCRLFDAPAGALSDLRRERMRSYEGDIFPPFFYRYRHGIVLSYFAVYLVWFCQLERTVQPVYWIHSWLDDLIPFQELFIVPYLFWFVYIGAAIVYFLLKSPEEFLPALRLPVHRMTLCLTIYTFFPQRPPSPPLSFPGKPLYRHGPVHLPRWTPAPM